MGFSTMTRLRQMTAPYSGKILLFTKGGRNLDAENGSFVPFSPPISHMPNCSYAGLVLVISELFVDI
jgi:hypothetical protein